MYISTGSNNKTSKTPFFIELPPSRHCDETGLRCLRSEQGKGIVGNLILVLLRAKHCYRLLIIRLLVTFIVALHPTIKVLKCAHRGLPTHHSPTVRNKLVEIIPKTILLEKVAIKEKRLNCHYNKWLAPIQTYRRF